MLAVSFILGGKSTLSSVPGTLFVVSMMLIYWLLAYPKARQKMVKEEKRKARIRAARQPGRR
jgi:hypothetical protein